MLLGAMQHIECCSAEVQKAFQDREGALLNKERSVVEGTRSLEERTAAVTTREGRVQGLEGLKIQLDADKAASEQRRLQLDSAETEVSQLCRADAAQ